MVGRIKGEREHSLLDELLGEHRASLLNTISSCCPATALRCFQKRKERANKLFTPSPFSLLGRFHNPVIGRMPSFTCVKMEEGVHNVGFWLATWQYFSRYHTTSIQHNIHTYSCHSSTADM